MKFLTALGLTLAITTAAAAQDTPASDSQSTETNGTQTSGGSSTSSASILVPIDNDDTPVPQLNLMVDQVEGLDVIGSDGNEIGAVEDVLGDQNGEPQAIVIEVGGFLGVGQRRVILMLSDVELEMGRLRTSMTRDQLNSLPEYGG